MAPTPELWSSSWELHLSLKWTTATGFTPWSPSTYWSPWELQFHSDHVTPLLKPSVVPYHPQERISSFHMQDHRGTFPPAAWDRYGSLNTCFTLWSFWHHAHCSFGTECPSPIFTWQNPTLHLGPTSDVVSSKKCGLLSQLNVATPFSAFPHYWDNFL